MTKQPNPKKKQPKTLPENRCPLCQGSNVEKVHYHGSGAIPECDFLECNDCEHQWGHS